jgi:hypothetical protein
MDLNHARLPIPPRWQVDFNRRGGLMAAGSGRPAFSILQPDMALSKASRRYWPVSTSSDIIA